MKRGRGRFGIGNGNVNSNIMTTNMIKSKSNKQKARWTIGKTKEFPSFPTCF